MIFDCGGKSLDLSQPGVMGILNVTPDSFSDGGQFTHRDAALRQARTLVDDGADIIDVGGESTRPGAAVVPLQEEIDRVAPIIEAISREFDIPISIDTMKPEVMRAAVNAGAGLINDVNALRSEGALEMAAELNVSVCLMHMQGTPQTMQNEPHYADVVTEVTSFLLERAQQCQQAGIAADKIMFDPGIGFGKRARHNLRILKHLSTFTDLAYPVLLGVSRKSVIGDMLKVSVDERLSGSLAITALAVQQGVKLFRVHDVRQTVQAIKISQAIQQVSDFD